MMQGRRLRALRRQHKWSQHLLGCLIGQDQQYISKVELGIVQEVTVDTLERLCRTLRVSADYLLGLTDDPTPPARRRSRTRHGRQDEEEEALAWEVAYG